MGLSSFAFHKVNDQCRGNQPAPNTKNAASNLIPNGCRIASIIRRSLVESKRKLSAAFEMTVPVLPADIDEQNHVNNTVYLRWVQDVATAHWKALARAEAQAAVGWVVLRHEIDYKMPANLGDEIVLRTWVGKASRLTFERFTEMRRRIENQLLAQARTLWVPIDVRTGKPVRVPPEVRSQFSI